MNKTLLVVEDDEDLRELMCRALEREGYRVATASDGEEALSVLAGLGGSPCLVVLDLVMSGMNGWDFFSALKANPALRDVPIVIHSSVPNDAPDGASKVLQKPFGIDRLIAVVNEYCHL